MHHNINQLQNYKAPTYIISHKKGATVVNMYICSSKFVEFFFSSEMTLLSTSEVTLPSALLCPPSLLGLAPTIFSNLDFGLFDLVDLLVCALFDPGGPQTSLALPSKSWPQSSSFSTLFLTYLKDEINQILFDQHVTLGGPYQNQKLGTASACLVLIKAVHCAGFHTSSQG